MICDDIKAVMGIGDVCEDTDDGARFVTHCLYPSFEPVAVYVTKLGDGYRVSDGGGAVRSSWLHGRDGARMLAREADRHHLRVSGPALVADAPSIEWLRAAILAVANGSAGVANTAVGKAVAAAETELKDRIRDTISGIAPPELVGTDIEIVGNSGDTRRFDYGVRVANDNTIAINAVAHHRNSVASKFLTFSDTQGIANVVPLGVYERSPDRGDLSLLIGVAEVIPVRILDKRLRSVIA